LVKTKNKVWFRVIYIKTKYKVGVIDSLGKVYVEILFY
jgi:hypothetical protein